MPMLSRELLLLLCAMFFLSSLSLPHQIYLNINKETFNGQVFPLTLAPTDKGISKEATLEYVRANKERLGEEMSKYGCILFRGFPLKTAADFDSFASSFDLECLPYVGGAAPRTLVAGNVFTTNESPPECPIPFHHEMAQSPEYPQRVFFFCEIPAARGGETPLLISNIVYERMNKTHPDFVAKVATHGVIYTRIIGEGNNDKSAIGRGWKATYGCETKEEAEKIAAKIDVNLHWLEDGWCKTVTNPIPAVRDLKGKKQWFNSIVAAYTGWVDDRNDPKHAVKFGNGDPMDGEAIAECDKVMQEICIDIPWEAGDVMMIDNRQVMHARRTFERPRRVLAYLTKSG